MLNTQHNFFHFLAYHYYILTSFHLFLLQLSIVQVSLHHHGDHHHAYYHRFHSTTPSYRRLGMGLLLQTSRSRYVLQTSYPVSNDLITLLYSNDNIFFYFAFLENRHFASGVVNRTGQPAPPSTENIERVTSEREQAARIRRRIKSSKDSTTTKKRPRSKRFHLDDEASHLHHTHHSHHMHQHFKES